MIPTSNAAAAQIIPAENYQQSQDVQIPNDRGEPTVEEPNLADIIPLASRLSGSLVALKIEVGALLDLSAVENSYTEIEASLKDSDYQLEGPEDSRDYTYRQLVELSEEIRQTNELLIEASTPLNEAIHRLSSWRKNWLEEERRWNQWQDFLNKDRQFTQLEDTFTKAHDTIRKALDIIFQQLEAMLTVQKRGGRIQEKILSLAAELEGKLAEERLGGLLDTSPPMFSYQYLSQFSSELWLAAEKGLANVRWHDSQFFAQHGLFVLCQGLLFLAVMIAMYLKREALKDANSWRSLSARPLSAGLFLGSMVTLLFYEYLGAPATWRLVLKIICGISFARLSGEFTGVSWKRQFVYGLVILYLIGSFVNMANLPLPLYRIYTLLAALLGLVFCLQWAAESRRAKEPNLYFWLLRLGSVYFGVIMIAELWGKEALASYLYTSLIRSTVTVLVFMLSIRVIHEGPQWLFLTSLFHRVAVFKSGDADALVRRIQRFIDVAILGLVLLPAIIAIWGIYDSLQEAMKGLLALGFNLRSQRISVGLIIASVGILYGSFLASWIVQKLLMDEAFLKRQVQSGVRHSVGRLVHYVIVFVGFLFAISTLGFDITKLTIILSALGVGIGFGLQGVVNNFVSGLILLFERPVRVGDSIELAGKWAEIKRIGLRATTVQTLEQADVIIPNADLIANQVTNWTLSNRQVRLTIPVGVAYGSDVPLVMKTLIECANANSLVTKKPDPQVLFLSFGESSLTFELRVWVTDADHRLKVGSELHQEIDRRFREANIEIAFPQMDLHLRSTDDAAEWTDSA